MEPRTRIDPTPITLRSRLSAMDQLKDQLTSLAQGRHTVNRFIDLAKDRLETAWDELRPEETGELGIWLSSRIQAGTGTAKIKWDLIRGVFEAVRDARVPTLSTPFERPLSAAVSDFSRRHGPIGFSETRGTTEAGSMSTIFEIPAGWPQEDPVLSVDTMPLRSAPVPGPWRPARFVWIAIGVTVLFAFGGSYWLTKRAPPPPATANLAVALPMPQLVVGLAALTDQSLREQAPAAAQLPVLGLNRSPQFAIGAFPMTHLPGPPLPAQVGERPPTEPLPSPALPLEPALNATSHSRLSPVPTPSKSPGAVRF
jgi:hypothetical protein